MTFKVKFKRNFVEYGEGYIEADSLEEAQKLIKNYNPRELRLSDILEDIDTEEYGVGKPTFLSIEPETEED
jgi:hypothetical protein